MLRVLILQDDPVDAVLLQEAINSAGHEVVGWVVKTEDAVELALARRPHLLIVDTSFDPFETSTDSLIDIRRKVDADIVFLAERDSAVREALSKMQPLAILDLPVQHEALSSVLCSAEAARPARP